MNAYNYAFSGEPFSYLGTNTGQSSYTSFNIALSATTAGASVNAGTMVTYTMATGTAYSAGQAGIGSAIIAASEEDLEDIIDSDAAMAEARAKGTRSWRQIRKELGL